MCFHLGSFGILTLQIPVVGGFRGGDVHIDNPRQTRKIFKTSHFSQQAYFSTAYYAESKITSQPVTNGCRLELVFILCRKTETGLRCVASNPFSSHQNLGEEFKVLLTNFWKESQYPAPKWFVIPLDHRYQKKNLRLSALKDKDRALAQVITSCLGDSCEIQLATVKKYVGYKKNDWTKFGISRLRRTNYGNLPDPLKEKHWTEYFAAYWTNTDGLPLNLPPLEITVPEQLLGKDEVVFCFEEQNSPAGYGRFDGVVLERASIVVWPRQLILPIASYLGIDKLLDEIEKKSKNEARKREEVKILLDHCQRSPNEIWYVNVGNHKCDDFRCHGSVSVPRNVALKRAKRLVNLCLMYFPEAGNQMLNILFSQFDKLDDLLCHACHPDSHSHDYNCIFVGGICSDEVAVLLAELVSKEFTGEGFEIFFEDLKNRERFDYQVPHIAQFAICLYNRQCIEGAKFVCNAVYDIFTEYVLEETVPMSQVFVVQHENLCKPASSVIKMLFLIDGPSLSEGSRLFRLHSKLESKNIPHTMPASGQV